MKKIFLVFAFIAMVFGEDITTITNTGSANLPKIIVQDASNLDDENFGQKSVQHLMLAQITTKIHMTRHIAQIYQQMKNQH